MENLIRKFFRTAKQVRLEKEKKDSIRDSVLLAMKENPLPAKESFWSRIFTPRFKPAYITISSVALVLLIGGAVSASANSALPGDALYPIKLGFNEKVLQVLSFSEDAKIKLDVRLADLRLKEAEKLAAEGKITKKNQAEIDNNFKAQADKVSKIIDNLNDAKMYDAAQKISSDFKSSLNGHGQVLQKIKAEKNKNEKNQDSVDNLINKINSVKDSLDKKQEQKNNKKDN